MLLAAAGPLAEGFSSHPGLPGPRSRPRAPPPPAHSDPAQQTAPFGLCRRVPASRLLFTHEASPASTPWGAAEPRGDGSEPRCGSGRPPNPGPSAGVANADLELQLRVRPSDPLWFRRPSRSRVRVFGFTMRPGRSRRPRKLGWVATRCWAGDPGGQAGEGSVRRDRAVRRLRPVPWKGVSSRNLGVLGPGGGGEGAQHGIAGLPSPLERTWGKRQPARPRDAPGLRLPRPRCLRAQSPLGGLRPPPLRSPPAPASAAGRPPCPSPGPAQVSPAPPKV